MSTKSDAAFVLKTPAKSFVTPGTAFNHVAESNLHDLEVCLRELVFQNNTEIENRQRLEFEVDQKDDKIEDLKIELDELAAENACQAEENASLKREKSKWTSEKEKMMATIAQHDSEKKSMQSQMEAMRNQITEMEERHGRELREKYDEVRMRLFGEFGQF